MEKKKLSLTYRIIRFCGINIPEAEVGKDCYIGYSVYMDLNNAKLITVEDHVHIYS